MEGGSEGGREGGGEGKRVRKRDGGEKRERRMFSLSFRTDSPEEANSIHI